MAETLTTTTDTHTVFVDRREQQCGKHEQAIEDIREEAKYRREQMVLLFEGIQKTSDLVHTTNVGIVEMKSLFSNLSNSVEKDSKRIDEHDEKLDLLRTEKLLNDGKNQQRKGTGQSVKEWLGWIFAAASMLIAYFTHNTPMHK
jgi:hypothetical protein